MQARWQVLNPGHGPDSLEAARNLFLRAPVVLGVISRVAPQITVFSVGFPVTIGVGLVGLLLTLPALQQPFVFALERLLATMR